MKIIQKLGVAISGLFAFSTVICGFSISQAAVVEQSSLYFHMGFAAVTLLASFGTIVLMAIQNKKQ